MRIPRLMRTASDAQIVLVKASLRSLGRQAVFLAASAVFGLFALAALHVGGYLALVEFGSITSVWSALIVVGADLLVCLIALVLARSGGPDARAIEARIVRDRALDELRNGLAIATISGPAGRLAGRGALGIFRRIAMRRRRPSKHA